MVGNDYYSSNDGDGDYSNIWQSFIDSSSVVALR